MSLDKLLATGARFNWLTPIIDLYKDITRRSHCDITIGRYTTWSAGEVRRLLKRHNIEPWGLMYTDHTFEYRVREAEVKRAEYILRQNNIPIISIA